MNEQIYISLFKDVKNPLPVADIPLTAFYDNIINGEFKEEVEAIRETADPQLIKLIKKGLPAVTISGTFNERKSVGLKQHSGRICIDIDGKDNPKIEDWSELRATLGTWNEVEFAALSASGRGVFLVIPISNPKKHHEHFLALQKGFKKEGIVIDSACKDIPRLRFLTYDSEAVYNKDVVPFRQIKEEENKKKPVLSNGHLHSENSLEKTLAEVIYKRIDITENYSDWFAIGSALANEYGEAGRKLFHNLSCLSTKYKPSECDKQFDKCLKHQSNYSAGSLIWLARNHGINIYKN